MLNGHASVSHQGDRNQGDIPQIFGMLRTINTKVEDLRSLLSQRRKEMLTVEEVAETCGRSPYTVRRWIAQQKIQAIRVQAGGPKGRLLVARCELDRLIAAGQGGEILEAAIN